MGIEGRSICIIGANYSPEVSGIAPYTTAMARHLASLGASVSVITGVPHYPEWAARRAYERGILWREDLDGVRVVRHRHLIPRSQGLAGRGAFETSFLAVSAASAIRSKADAVIAIIPALSAGALGTLAAAHRPARLGIVVQDLVGNAASESGTTSSGVGRVIRGAEYGLLRRADLVGVVTGRFGEIAVENGVKPDRVVSLPNFTHIEASSLSRDEARRRLGWPENRFLVLHTGNIGRKQGLETAIEAARLAATRRPDVDLFFLGDGNQRSHLEQVAAGLPNVRFLDAIDSESYPHALAAADVLLLNELSTVREMSMPSKLTSYFAAGRPVVAGVASGGITEQVASASLSCLVVAAGDAEALLGAVERLADDKLLAERLAVNAREYAAAEMSESAALQRYADFAQRLL